MATDTRLFALRDRISARADSRIHDAAIDATADAVYNPTLQSTANADCKEAFRAYVADVVAKRHGDGGRDINAAIASLPAPL